MSKFTYDALNRRTFAGFGQSGGSYESTINYTFDAGNRLTQAVDSITGTVTRGYDGLDRLTSETTPQGAVSYTYDLAGRRNTMTVTGQAATSYGFDNANRLDQITQGTSTVQFAYDGAGRRTSITLPNGVVESYTYDAGSQLAGISYTLGQNPLGNLAYSYDLAGRRVQATGNLAHTGLPQPISAIAYNASNQLTQWGTATPTYDANGNTLSDGTNSYTWDARNHLVSMNSGGASFQYDPFGRRVAKTTILGTTNYLYDDLNSVQELAGATPTATSLTGSIHEYFQRTDSNGPANFLTDAMGSTLALTDPSGNTLAQFTYEPFGNTTITGSSANPYQYTGRENDGPGIYFYRNRDYSATFQRFISEDPIGIAGGINLYAYAGNNPISFRDPLGTDKCQAFYCDPNVWLAAGTIVLTLALPEVGALEFAEFAAEAGEGFEAAEAAAETTEGVEAVGDVTTVGRWMSPDELEAMQNSGRVQESFNNGVTSVTVPPNPAAYMNAPEGDVFVQFDVPSDSVQAIDSSNGWGKIYGPNSVPFGQYYGITEMPPATNIMVP